MTRLAGLIASLLCATSVAAQQARGGTIVVWSGRTSAGSTISILNGDGFIHVGESTSGRAEVRATRTRAARASGEDKTFDVEESGDRVTVCTLYLHQRTCRDRNTSKQTGSMRVDYTVLVPRDVRVDVATGRGEIIVDGAGATVTAATGMGRVFIATVRGPVNVSSGNGDVDVRVQSVSTDPSVNVVTGSGTIRVSVPADFGGSIDTQSGNGTLRSDFDITILGRIESNHVRGTIGRGSSRIHLQTGNGRIELRKS